MLPIVLIDWISCDVLKGTEESPLRPRMLRQPCRFHAFAETVASYALLASVQRDHSIDGSRSEHLNSSPSYSTIVLVN
jgi:hypothetical protein